MADADTAVLDQAGTETSEATVEEQSLTTGQLEGETPKPEAKKEAEIDWAIEGPKERAARLKVENDLKALRTGRQKAEDRDSLVRQAADKSEEAAQTARLVLESIRPLLEPDAIAKIDAAQSAFSQARQRQGFEGFKSEYAAKIAEIAESQGVDPNTDEAYAGVRTLFSNAVSQGSREGILKATLQARELGNTLKAGGESRQVGTPNGAEKKAAAPKGVMTDLGPGSGGVGSSPSWARAQKIKNVSELSDAEYEKLVAS